MPIRKAQNEILGAKIELTLDFLGNCCSVFTLPRSESWSAAEITQLFLLVQLTLNFQRIQITRCGGSAVCPNKTVGTAHFNKG